MTCSPNSIRRARAGFTLMELLVVIAIILVLAVIAFPAFNVIRQKANKSTAMGAMRNLGSAANNYASQNDGVYPAEDSKGSDTWSTAADPANSKAWYNALPRQLGSKGVGDYVTNPRAFYTKENLLFLPGATYPDSDKKLAHPLFAIAINTKLQRKDEEGKKAPLRMATITSPSKTVLFLEQGLPSEKKAFAQQSKYDGSPKGSARSFPGRYSGQGILTFVDGHADSFEPKDLLTETGAFIFPQEQSPVIWTRNPEENPNKQ